MDLRARVETLNAQRLRAWEQGKELLEATEGRTMTAEERQTFDRINQEIQDIDDEVRALVTRETKDREADQLRAMTLSVFGEHRAAQNDQRGVDMFRQWLSAPRGSDLRSQAFEIDIQRVARERELLRAGATQDEIRALAWDATSGSLVVPTTMARSLFDKLEDQIAAFRIGATRLVTSTGENMQMPKLVTHAIATQVSGQGTALAGSDPVMGRVDVNVYKYGQLVKVSNELLNDAAFGVEQFLGGDLGYSLGRIVDADLIVGTGTGEPTGMSVLIGAGTNAPIKTGGSLIAPTVEKFIDLQYSVPDAIENPAWLMHKSTAGTIRKLRDGAGGTVGAFLWEPSLTNGLQTGSPDRFLGAPVYTDTNCASAASNATLATYGDFSEYVVRTVGNPTIERDDSVYFATDEAAFRGKWRVGGNHRNNAVLNNLVQNV